MEINTGKDKGVNEYEEQTNLFIIALIVTGIFPQLNRVKVTGWQYGILFLGLLSGIIHIGMGFT